MEWKMTSNMVICETRRKSFYSLCCGRERLTVRPTEKSTVSKNRNCNFVMVKINLFLYFNCFFIFLLPTVLCFNRSLRCPNECKCITATKELFCIGGKYPRIPPLPNAYEYLTWTDATFKTFAIKDLPSTLKKIIFRRVHMTTLVDETVHGRYNVTEFKVQGCCADRFPNVSNFPFIKNFIFNVRCRSNATVVITEDHVSGLASLQKKNLLSTFDAQNSCISSIQQNALQHIFKFPYIHLQMNYLRKLNVSFKNTFSNKCVNLSMNSAMDYLNLGSLQPEKLDISSTKIALRNLVDNTNLNMMKFRSGTLPFSLSTLCRKFPNLVIVDVSNQSAINTTGLSRCKRLDEIIMDHSKQSVFPNMTETKIYNFIARSNLYNILDLSLFSAKTRHLHVSNNVIKKVVRTGACKIFTKTVKHLDLSNNNLSSISRDLIECLPTKSHFIQLEVLNVSGNPMDELFKMSAPFKTTPRQVKEVDLSSIETVRHFGRFPKELFQNFYGIESLYVENNGLLSLDHFTMLIRNAGLHKSLMILLMSRNQFTSVANRTFLGFSKLKILNLAKNNITFIDRYAFYGLTSLEYLDLSGNRLTVIDKWLIGLSFMRKLKSANLSNNQFNCACKKLRLLNGSHFSAYVMKNDLLMQVVKGLTCMTPKTTKYHPLRKRFLDMEKQPCRDLMEPEKAPSSLPPKVAIILISIVVGIGVLIVLILLAYYVVARQRRKAHTYRFVQTKNHSIPISKT